MPTFHATILIPANLTTNLLRNGSDANIFAATLPTSLATLTNQGPAQKQPVHIDGTIVPK